MIEKDRNPFTFSKAVFDASPHSFFIHVTSRGGCNVWAPAGDSGCDPATVRAVIRYIRENQPRCLSRCTTVQVGTDRRLLKGVRAIAECVKGDLRSLDWVVGMVASGLPPDEQVRKSIPKDVGKEICELVALHPKYAPKAAMVREWW